MLTDEGYQKALQTGVDVCGVTLCSLSLCVCARAHVCVCVCFGTNEQREGENRLSCTHTWNSRWCTEGLAFLNQALLIISSCVRPQDYIYISWCSCLSYQYFPTYNKICSSYPSENTAKRTEREWGIIVGSCCGVLCSRVSVLSHTRWTCTHVLSDGFLCRRANKPQS